MVLPPRMPQKESFNKKGGYSLVKKFLGYRAREDNTMLPTGTLVAPSKNIVINTSGRISTVKGYVADGAVSTVIDSGILSNYDFTNFKGDVRNMRAGFLSSLGNDGKLQYRYVTGTSKVNWVDLKISLTNLRISYCTYWDTAALVKNVLWVDGTNNVFAWNGSVTTLASATVNTVTKQGTNTWAQEGFAQTGTRSVVIGGVSATYSGGEGTTTLTGVSVDFSATAVGAITHQAPITTTLASMTAILATFGPTVIGCGRRNQVYLGASNSNSLYISKGNDYTNYAFTAPVRIVGEGNLIQLDSPPNKFIAQEVNNQGPLAYDMFISEGTDTWGIIRASLSSDLTKETLEHIRLKTAPLQSAKSERLATKMKNQIMFVGNDNVANFLGLMSFQFVPAIIDFSFPIIDDMNSYDFTDASIFYHRNYIYIAIPKHGIVRVYNMSDQTQQYTTYVRDFEDVTKQPWFWEAPVGYPLSGFYVVAGELYGHSYTTSESYKLLSGGSFNGQDIDVNATFSFDDTGYRTQSKASDEIWIEGYISQNTTLNVVVAGDLDAEQVSQTVTVVGNDNTIVAFGSGAHAIGKNSLGTQPLGGAQVSTVTRPAWFHVAKTYPNSPSYLEQISFYTKGIDLSWEIITFGTNSTLTNEGNNSITQ
jgi:hypothetical protein